MGLSGLTVFFGILNLLSALIRRCAYRIAAEREYNLQMAEIAQRNKGIEVLNKKLRKNRANGEFDQISDLTDEFSVRSSARPSSTTKVKILNK